MAKNKVVICSKFITFAVTKTTRSRNSDRHSCCDLLKIHYLCGDKDNLEYMTAKNLWVVICSKFITFAVTKTTRHKHWSFPMGLWFAQNSLPLRWQRQHHRAEVHPLSRCDLLKIHYLCGDKDNVMTAVVNRYVVVICSKFITFAVTKTTLSSTASSWT